MLNMAATGITGIRDSAIVCPGVEMGNDVLVEDYCIIGCPFKGYDGEKTLIGDNAVIRAGTVIYAGNRIGHDFQTGNKANIRELNDIGDNVSIGTLSVIEHHVVIRSGVRIHSQVFVPEYTVLDEECWLGPNVVLTNARFPKHPDVKNELQGPHVCRNAKIGANATLLPGIVIGENSLVGAGSVVTKDIPDGVIVSGNPARVMRNVHY